jgi:restriction system protein
MELGQTKDAIIAQHGPATEENHSKNTAVYRAAGWKVDVQYRDGVACRLIFSKIGWLTEQEIESILVQNAGGGEWKELETSSPKRSWQRTDFAAAECDRTKPACITFMQAPAGQDVATAPALAENSPTPSAPDAGYASERQASPPSKAMPIPDDIAVVFGAFVENHLAVFLLPLLLLFGSWLINRLRRKRIPASVPARRVVTPRLAADAMAAEPVECTLDTLEPEGFDLLAGEIFRRKGYAIEISGGVGSDGANDLTLRRGDEVILVQCRHWHSYKVSVPSVEEFYGTIMAAGATAGIFVTSGDYTREARTFAEGKPIRLIDRAGLKQLVGETSEPGENLFDLSHWVDRFSAKVMVADPACPFCGKGMKLKRGFQGRPFWSCQTFPHCGGKRDGRVELLRTRTASPEI